jgi:hypothetical protein
MTRVAVDLDLLQMAYDKIAADSPYPSALLDRLADALYLQEQKQEPVAYWHRDKGFYWAKPTEIRMDAITDVPPLPLYAALPKPDAIVRTIKTERKPRIICGFVDVQFDGEGWFCAKCSERMPANYEALVKHYSGDIDYLKLMQRKVEAIRARGSK